MSNSFTQCTNISRCICSTVTDDRNTNTGHVFLYKNCSTVPMVYRNQIIYYSNKKSSHNTTINHNPNSNHTQTLSTMILVLPMNLTDSCQKRFTVSSEQRPTEIFVLAHRITTTGLRLSAQI